jgi:hypothetical protein
MATEPLLLAAHECARGLVASLPGDLEVAAVAASSAHLAVLLRARTGQNYVRLGVLKADEDAQPELIELLPESDAPDAEAINWTLTWSPDRKFLLVSGRIPVAEGGFGGVMWLFAHPEWLAASDAARGPPLLLRVDPAKYLSAKHWDPATSIVSAFFPAQSGSQVLVLSADGTWLSVSVQLAKLALVAMDQTASEDRAGLFSMKVVKKLTEWHAGVTAACYDPESATLVVSGGVRDPSSDLEEKQASSLSVWKVDVSKESDEVAELQDFTMVLKGTKKQLGEEATEGGVDQPELVSTTADGSGGLLTSVKSTLFAPLKMMVGGETAETRVIPGSIRHLALAPNGNYVSMVDDLGRIAIRQVDVCADVLKWKAVVDVRAANVHGVTTKLVVWLATDLLALVLTDNNIIYARFIPHTEESVVSEPTSSDSDTEITTPAGSTGHLVLLPTRLFSNAGGAPTDDTEAPALDNSGLGLGEQGELLQSGARCALEYLRVVSEKRWVLDECLHLIADDSSAAMKRILDLAWDTWTSLNDGDEVTTDLSTVKVDLQRYMYRLETLHVVLCEEEDVPATSVAGDQLFDGATYAQFRSGSVLAIAKQFAREGRLRGLTVLFRRHAWNLLPHWLEVLELLPPTVSPLEYAPLLPAVASQLDDDGQFCTLGESGDGSEDDVLAIPVALLEENRLKDLTGEELSAFEECTRADREERNASYGDWFARRIVELDARYGQLTLAFELSRLASKCLSGWPSQEAKKPLEELLLHTESLFKCVHLLHLSACCLLPLSEWSALSIQEQVMLVVDMDENEFFGDADALIDYLDAVFVSENRDRLYTLDGLFSWIAATISPESSLDTLTLAAQLIHRCYTLIDAAPKRASFWEAVRHVLDELVCVIQAQLDSVAGYSEDANANAAQETALGCIGVVREVISLPIWDEGDSSIAGAKEHYEEMLAMGMERAHACELLDLLTYGAVKISPAQLRGGQDEEEDENLRLEAVFQVFVSNPSNYKTSARAREWLAQHHAGEAALAGADAWDEPLAAVMHLAKLLRVDSHKLDIWMKGSYAALYCMDYDVAYALTTQVIDGIPTDLASASGSGNKLTLVYVVSLVLDLASASSFRSWGKKRKLCCALFNSVTVSSSDLFAHQVTDLVLSCLEKIDAIQALMTELGLSDGDLEQRRLAGGKASSSAETVLLNELKVVVDLLHEEKKDRQFLLRLLQRGLQLTQVLSCNDVGAQEQGAGESTALFLQQMTHLCVEEAVALASTHATDASTDWQQCMELGLSYLALWGELCTDDEEFETFCANEVLSSVFSEQPASPVSADGSTREAVVRRLHHFFLLQAAQSKEDAAEGVTENLLARRRRFKTMASSYGAARRALSPVKGTALDDVTATAEEFAEPHLVVSEARHQVFVRLAQQCQERLASRKKFQELEKMSTFFNAELDLESFSQDESYRNEKIMLLATKKEHFQVARQFAGKYGIDEYKCVLAYIKHALLSPADTSRMGRREQLDQAFRIDQVDVLEEALQRPIAFGDFLLKSEAAGEPSLYEALDGTDQVGILLVLRMVLECSKRIYQESAESEPPHERGLFPLPKPSTDRITLLFMCLKKLMDIGDSLEDVESIDLKLVGAASTTADLLTPLASSRTDPQAMVANRQVAVEATRPLLTGKTIKVVTKILRKLHHVTPSAMVMIYINDLLTGIWREHGASGTSTGALSADLAVYAYESCVPCLSVLSNEHLMLFHYLFLDGSSGKSPPELVAHLNIAQDFYGQPLTGLQHYGALLTPHKRVELVTDTLTLFQTKYNSWQTSGPRSNVSSASSTSSSSSTSWDPAQFKRKEQELHYLERELAESLCLLLLSEIDADGNQAELPAPQSLEPLAESLKAWFAMDSLQQAANEDVLGSSVLLELCQRVHSVALATLVMELVLRGGGSKASGDVAADAIVQSYRTALADLVDRSMGSAEDGAKPTGQWVERLAWAWVTGAAAPSSSQVAGLGNYLRVVSSAQRDLKSEAHATYERVLTLLTQSPSLLLKEIGSNRLQEMQTPADDSDCLAAGVVTAVRAAVLAEWRQLVSIREERRKWAAAAVLSHVLTVQHSEDADLAKWDFGLRVKAVWAALLAKHEMETTPDSQRVFHVPSGEISDHFAAVFEELLGFVETCASDDEPKVLRFAETATVALSNLLVRHDQVRGGSDSSAQRSAAAWQNEQARAVQTRILAQFQVGSVAEGQAPPQNKQDVTCWSALFARGVWGAGLLAWYTTHAYAELSGEEEATEAVILVHWEAHNIDLAIQLLLMCPFDALRAKYADRALSAVRQLPRGSRSWAAAVELALLRFDVAVLLQHGLHASVVAFSLQAPSKNPALWTSSGNYVVCALVAQEELAAAGRLACALQHAHPLLWDVESARLLLANFLKSLASKAKSAQRQHQVYAQTSDRLAAALLHA